MAAEPLKPVYLLMGSDRPKVGRALRRLRARVGEDSLELLGAPDATGADAVAACNALGLFGGEAGRLVVVRSVERWSPEDVGVISAYLENPAPGAVLALVAEEAVKSRALADACGKAGQVLAFDAPRPRDLPAWVRNHFERLGARVDADAARALVELVGDDVSALANEAEKLATWADGATVSRRDVENLAVSLHDAPAWALTDAWGARDVPALLAACEAELERDAKPFSVTMRLASHIGRVRGVQALVGEGVPIREIAKRLRMHEFTARKAAGHAANYTREELDDAVLRLAALDAALKGASRLPDGLELERTLVEITRSGEPAHR